MSDPSEAPPEMDYAEHDRTWAGFVAVTKWSMIGLCVLLILMAIFLL